MRICVYCGSLSGSNGHYASVAHELGAWIAQKGHTLVYGGGGIGLMNAVASGALEQGGEVIGVMPQFLIDLEELKPELEDVRVTQTMAERKTMMIELSDAFVALPGGPGTVEEISEVMSQCKLGNIDGPCVLFNIDGFYEPLAGAYDMQVTCGFTTPAQRAHLKTVSSLDELAAIVDAYEERR